MGEGYWRVWNSELDARIERRIEANRKTDAVFELAAPNGTTVEVRQLSHAFRFGAHAQKIGRLQTAEVNRRYEENFAGLFNSATITFYWREFEPQAGNPHFHTNPGDLESAFTSGERARMDPRSAFLASPARSTDQFLEFAHRHGMWVHGHPLVWGSFAWMMPYWIYEQYCPRAERDFLNLPIPNVRDQWRLFAPSDWQVAYTARVDYLFHRYSERELAARVPTYVANLTRLHRQRIVDILNYCGERVDSWDVVNESAWDWSLYGSIHTGEPLTKSRYGIMPADYTLDAFLTAASVASPRTRLAINDWWLGDDIVSQVRELDAASARVDMVGTQFHVFSDDDFRSIVNGERIAKCRSPEEIEWWFGLLSKLKRPVHLSEITLPAPGLTAESLQQQAIVAWNYYRLWFSLAPCAAITWWHSIDGADAYGGEECATGGIWDSEAQPKPVFYALDELINRRWRTCLQTTVKDGKVAFRGFRGTYELTWTDADGERRRDVVSLEDESRR